MRLSSPAPSNASREQHTHSATKSLSTPPLYLPHT
jgi:hypothetical protein